MSTIFSLPRVVPVNSAGQPYAGAKLYFYGAGTVVHQAVYTDSALSVAHAQPVVADSNGRFAAIYLDPDAAADYRTILYTSADVLIYDQDNIPKTGLTQAIVGSYLWPATDAETSAGVTPTNYYYEPGNVLRYGTNADPGTTDMTTAVQAALDSSSSVYIPAGTYAISGNVTASQGQLIYGDGIDTILTFSDGGLLFLASTGKNITVRDLKISLTGTGQRGISFDDNDDNSTSATRFSLENVWIIGSS